MIRGSETLTGERFESDVRAALDAVESADATLPEKVEMLVEMAMGMQQRPKSIEQLQAAIFLYRKALNLCPEQESLLRGRTLARMATALQTVPGGDFAPLEEALSALETARVILEAEGSEEETAEVDMNLGLVLQSLASCSRAPIQDAIAAHQRALRVFDRDSHPKEFAILQNNLATAFLSIPFTDERAKMREALAVTAFEEGLKVVTLIDHPGEYAMLQNNLGNALQSVSTSHSVENHLRAVEAYDEALKVRTRRKMPVEYANTIANKASCLWNLPDDPARPELGNVDNLEVVESLFNEAIEIFRQVGELGKVEAISEAVQEIGRLRELDRDRLNSESTRRG